MRPRPERLLDYREFPVLFVDDEPENLRVFELAFRREFRVATAQSGEEALRLLHEMPTAVVLSDQRMEGISGVELLGRIRDIDPRTVRILVTAYGDAETLRNAINNGSIYRYVPKPWEPEDMRLTLRNAIEVFALDREREELVRELGILNRVSKALNSQLELDPLLDLLVRTCTEELGYDGTTLLLFDERHERLDVVRGAPSGDELVDLSIPCQEANGFVRRLDAGHIESWRSEDILDLGGSLRRFATEIAAEEILIVPILGQQGAYGALVVDNRRGGRGFGASDRTLLGGLAAQAAISIRNAHLVSDLRGFQHRAQQGGGLRVARIAGRLASELTPRLEAVRRALAPQTGEGVRRSAARGLDEAVGTIETLSQLAAQSVGASEWCAMGEILGAACALVEAEAEAAGVGLDVHLGSDLPKLAIPACVLRELVLRLLRVALDGIQPGTGLEIRVHPRDGGIEMQIVREGEGFAPEQVESLVDPFEAGEADAMRAAFHWLLCHEIVATYGGSIEAEPLDEARGSLRVRLPAEPGGR